MKMLINGRKTESRSGKLIPVTNPVTGEVLDTVFQAGEEEMEEALEASVHGFRRWRAVPLKEKEKIFQKFYQLLEEPEKKREILSVLIKESGSSIRNGLFQYQGMPEIFKGYLEDRKSVV